MAVAVCLGHNEVGGGRGGREHVLHHRPALLRGRLLAQHDRGPRVPDGRGGEDAPQGLQQRRVQRRILGGLRRE